MLNPSEKHFRDWFVSTQADITDSEFQRILTNLSTTALLENVLEIDHTNYYLFSVCKVHVKHMKLIDDKPELTFVGAFSTWRRIK